MLKLKANNVLYKHYVKVQASCLVVNGTESSLKVPDLRSGWAITLYS